MFYFLHIVIVLYNLLLYSIFRGGIYDYLRLSKMSKTNIRKNRKGLKNYWIYQSIHEQHSLGILYGLNILFLTSTIVYSVLVITLGFIKTLQPILFVLSVLLCIVEIPTMALASIYDCKAEFGRSFVLLTKRKESNGYYSSLLIMFPWWVTAVLICVSYGLL